MKCLETIDIGISRFGLLDSGQIYEHGDFKFDDLKYEYFQYYDSDFGTCFCCEDPNDLDQDGNDIEAPIITLFSLDINELHRLYNAFGKILPFM